MILLFYLRGRSSPKPDLNVGLDHLNPMKAEAKLENQSEDKMRIRLRNSNDGGKGQSVSMKCRTALLVMTDYLVSAFLR